MPHEEAVRACPATGKALVRPSSAARPPGPARPAAPPAKDDPSPPVAGSVQEDARVAANLALMGELIGGKYRVREVLGEGGMGTVFEAVHEGLGSAVAIKVLHPNQLQKRDSVQRFHHEARAAARIGHPNICEVHDVGSLPDGRPYLVMERLTGVTLAQRIQTLGGVPLQDVLDTLTQVLSGLHAAHEKGIIHRDVKPENVFLSQRIGCPAIAKVLDFGVSKVMTDHAEGSGFSEMEVTRTGVVLGTPYYLAPEQARGERNLDARVDLYACGVMLYEALTGRRPFRAPNYNALLIAILTATPRPVRELRPDLPDGFDRVLATAMARDRADRYQTALELQAALQPFLHTATARPSAAPPKPPPRPRVRSQNFDDQATDVDVPRPHARASRSPDSARTAPAPPRPPAAPTRAFTPRRAAPVLGPPLRPPDKSAFADDSATEIRSAAVRASLPEPGKKPEAPRPTPPRPGSTRPPPRR